MAVIIKDIDTPENCYECEFKIHTQDKIYCMFTDERIDYLESKNDSCPMVDVNDIIKKMEDMKNKDKIAEYPYVRCMDLLKEVSNDR